METQTKKVNTPKVLESQYLVRVNGEIVDTAKDISLKQARDIVRDLNITENVKRVEIVRQSITETVINTFEPKATVSLIAVDDLTLE